MEVQITEKIPANFDEKSVKISGSLHNVFSFSNLKSQKMPKIQLIFEI